MKHEMNNANNLWKLVYEYSWGDEDILGASVKVKKNTVNHEEYKVVFCQDVFLGDSMMGITSDSDITKIIPKISIFDEHSPIRHKQTLYIKAVCNPKPESLFTIIEKSEIAKIPHKNKKRKTGN